MRSQESENAMPNTTGGAKTKCPFYIKDAEKSISCEGMNDDVRCMVIRFRSEEEKAAYQEQKCQTYEYASRCWIAAALTKKYEGGEAEPEDTTPAREKHKKIVAARKARIKRKTRQLNFLEGL